MQVTRVLERALLPLAWLCSMVLIGAVFSILSYLLLHGYQSLDLKLIFGSTDPLDALFLKRRVFDGLFPAIGGTLLLVVLSVSWAIPIGMATGIYLAEYGTGKTKKILDLFFDILAGLPSIVIGLSGFALTIFLNKQFSGHIYPCLLVSSIALAFLVLPYIIRTTQTALEGIPRNLRMTALALGSGKLQNIVYVLLPEALPGIISGVILAIGRCAEDTAVIMLTGAVATAGMPRSLLSNYEALPFYIYYTSSQYMNRTELKSGYGAAIILLCICLVLFGLAFAIRKRFSLYSL